MKVSIKYFAPFDRISGKKEEDLFFEGTRISLLQLLETLVKHHPNLRDHIRTGSDEELRQRIIVAVEGEIASLEDYLEGNIKKVKILPTLAGGSECQRVTQANF